MKKINISDIKTKTIIFIIWIFISSLAAAWKFGCSNMVLVFAISGVTFWCYKKIQKKYISRRELVISGVYTVLLSQAITAGKQVHYNYNMRGGPGDNYINYDISCILFGLVLAFLIYPIVILLLELIKKYRLQNNSKLSEGKTDKRFFFIAWLVIYLCWVPYLLTFCPGGIVGDGACTLELSLQSGVPAGNHWVVLYILTLRFFLWIGSFFSSSINVGIFLYVIVQSLVYSAVCALVAAKLKKKGIPDIFVWITVLIYALSGFFASYSMSLWKDGIFSAAIILLVLLLWEYPEDKNVSVRYCVKFALISLFICFWRNNGLYVLVLCILGIAILFKKQGKHVILTGLCVVIVTIVIQGPVYDKLGIEKDSLIESFSVPLQQVAAVINEETELTDSQAEVLYSTIKKEDWAVYSPTLSDDLKASVDASYLSGHMADYIKVWAQLLFSHPGTYVRAYMMQTLGFWQPGVFYGNYWDYWIGVEDIFNRGYVNHNLIKEATGISVEKLLLNRMEFIPSGTMVWIMLFALMSVLCEESHRKKKLLILTPLIASWAIIMIAAPIAFAYRYIVMIPMAFPIIFALPFFNNGKYNENIEDNEKIISKKALYIKRAGQLLAITISLLCLVINIAGGVTIIKKYTGGQFTVYLAGDQYNANDYVKTGLSGNEDAYSWTDGDELSVSIPVKGNYDEASVVLSVEGTFNGDKSYIIKQNGKEISHGSIEGAGQITFIANIKDSDLAFDICFPDAQTVSDISKESSDKRKLALQVSKITVSEIKRDAKR